MSGEMRTCPECGKDELEVSFREGVCYYCCQLNQQLCDAHNIEYDEWQNLTDAQRSELIRQAGDSI